MRGHRGRGSLVVFWRLLVVSMALAEGVGIFGGFIYCFSREQMDLGLVAISFILLALIFPRREQWEEVGRE